MYFLHYPGLPSVDIADWEFVPEVGHEVQSPPEAEPRGYHTVLSVCFDWVNAYGQGPVVNLHLSDVHERRC